MAINHYIPVTPAGRITGGDVTTSGSAGAAILILRERSYSDWTAMGLGVTPLDT